MARMNAVLFDLGNVLVRVDISMFGRTLGPETEREIVPLAPELMAWARRYELGGFGTDIFLAGLQNIMGSLHSVHCLREAFQTIIGEPIEGMEELVEWIGETCTTALVSNTNEIHYLTSLTRVPALALLPTHYVSYQLKAMKPDERFYAAVLNDLNRPPEEVVFIDDQEENVEGARNAGMTGILFTGADDLRQQLEFLKRQT